jgi:DNA polymerase III delta subunit
LVKYLQESVTPIEKLTLEKEKTAQLLAIKAGEFQALNRVLEVLKTEELKVELDSVGN